MFKQLLIGIWFVAASLGANYITILWPEKKIIDEEQEKKQKLELITTDMLSTPVIRNGKVTGYIVIKLTFAVYEYELKKLALEPSAYLIDSAMRVLYENNNIDFTYLRMQDTATLANDMLIAANEKLKVNLVKDVLVNEINYVPRDEIRTNWIKQPPKSP